MIAINKIQFDELEVAEIVKSSVLKQDVAKKFGYKYYNGKISKLLDNIFNNLHLSIDHFDPFIKNKLKRKYILINKICPICELEFETQQNNPKEKTTCSRKCSNIYFSALKCTDAANLKRSLKLKKIS